MQSDFIKLSCPNCGATLEIARDVDRFICLYCSTQQIVRRNGSIISLHPLVEGIAKVQQGTDKTAAELAIRRLTEEIAVARTEESDAIEAANQGEPPSARVKVLPSNMEVLTWWGGIIAIILSFGLALQLTGEAVVLCSLPLLLGIILLIAYIPIRINRGKRTRIAEAAAQQEQERKKAARQDYANKKSDKVRQLQAALERNRNIVNS